MGKAEGKKVRGMEGRKEGENGEKKEVKAF